MATPSAASGGSPGYTAFHRLIHWLVAIAVAGLYATAFTLEGAEGALRDRLYILHWSFGVTVAALMAVRVVSRLAAPPAPITAPMPAIQRRAAGAVHILLYVGLILNPVLGYLAKSLYGGAITVFWLFELPALPVTDQDLAERVFALHEAVGIAVLALIAVHVAAALHHLARGDGIFARITTG